MSTRFKIHERNRTDSHNEVFTRLSRSYRETHVYCIHVHFPHRLFCSSVVWSVVGYVWQATDTNEIDCRYVILCISSHQSFICIQRQKNKIMNSDRCPLRHMRIFSMREFFIGFLSILQWKYPTSKFSILCILRCLMKNSYDPPQTTWLLKSSWNTN